MEYNLLEESWIPVLYRNGKYARIGILKAFEDAQEIRQIASSNPLDRAAILRFLFALILWRYRGDSSLDGRSQEKFDSTGFLDWMVDKKQCFYLFGAGPRFYQVRPKNSEKLSASNYLAEEVPTGNNSWHFRHSIDKILGLCPACCALGLLRLPLFATEGGKGNSPVTGKSPGLNAQPPVYAFPSKLSLLETLKSMLSRGSDPDLGVPAWEKLSQSPPGSGKVPLLFGLTWLPRKVWLNDPEPNQARCTACGRKENLVTKCVFDGYGSLKCDDRIWNDPNALRDGEAVVKPRNPLDSPVLASWQWAKWASCAISNSSAASGAWLVSFATKQNKYIEATEFNIRIEELGDNFDIEKSASALLNWAKSGSSFEDLISPKRRKNRLGRNNLSAERCLASIRPHIEHRVSMLFAKILEGDEKAMRQTTGESDELIKSMTNSIAVGATIAAEDKRRKFTAECSKTRFGVESKKSPVLKPRSEK